MTVLSDGDILRAIDAGEVAIDGFDAGCMRPSSYVLRLSSDILVRDGSAKVIDTKSTDTQSLFRRDIIDVEGYPLLPNKLYLARSVECVSLSAGICGDLSLLSCYARLGLLLNFGSNQVAATYGLRGSSALTFEIMNLSQDTIVIYPEVKFCHLRISRHESKAKRSYGGIYSSGSAITPANFQRKPAR